MHKLTILVLVVVLLAVQSVKMGKNQEPGEGTCVGEESEGGGRCGLLQREYHYYA